MEHFVKTEGFFILLMRGACSFAEKVKNAQDFGAEVVIDNTLTDPGEVIAGDINLDGTIDIATVVYTDNKTVWYYDY